MGESESESDGSGQARAFKAGFDRCAAGRGRRLEGALTWRASLETGAAVRAGSGLVKDREGHLSALQRATSLCLSLSLSALLCLSLSVSFSPRLSLSPLPPLSLSLSLSLPLSEERQRHIRRC